MGDGARGPRTKTDGWSWAAIGVQAVETQGSLSRSHHPANCQAAFLYLLPSAPSEFQERVLRATHPLRDTHPPLG